MHTLNTRAGRFQIVLLQTTFPTARSRVSRYSRLSGNRIDLFFQLVEQHEIVDVVPGRRAETKFIEQRKNAPFRLWQRNFKMPRDSLNELPAPARTLGKRAQRR